MTIVFQDGPSGAAGTNSADHEPDVGVGYSNLLTDGLRITLGGAHWKGLNAYAGSGALFETVAPISVNRTVRATFTYKSGGDEYGMLHVNYIDAENYLYAVVRNDASFGAAKVALIKRVAGVETVVGGVDHTFVADEPIALEATLSGGSCNLVRDGVEVVTPTSLGGALATAGATGAQMYGALAGDNATSFWLSDIEVEDLGEGGGGGEPALVFDDQPSATPSGYLIDPPVVVRVTTDGSATDTAFSGDVAIALVGMGGVLLGTLTVAAVAGIATFGTLRPCIAGTYTLEATAAGYDDATSDPFTVTSGSGDTIISGGSVFSRPIRRNEASADLRRIFLLIEDDAGAAWAGSVTGVKAKLAVNGGAETDSPADIVRLAGKLHYVTPAQPYTDVGEGAVITARVAAASGRREAVGAAEIIPGDSYAEAITQTGLVIAVMRASMGLDGWGFERDESGDVVRVTIPGVGVVEAAAVFSSSAKALTKLGA